ncbi:chalcone isomerase family protein [Roseomonas sp. NAR14]|uniref:Chalcone isomerase family protein n=1 Tax=Roseomonas acroporae TaxID=2937791 RepID=A0A9X1YBF2_9PROT|nr:chalcone isomerase family protein [Roseomonas acroporae]MCK8786637.1 chalcone isomerase family protein [Roseomonas acroporae]
MRRPLLLGLASAFLGTVPLVARATMFDGMTLPDELPVAGRRLLLNGMATRTYSILRIRIYTVGLYLERRSGDADAIMGSNQVKLFRFFFAHEVEADRARQSWRQGIDRNCPAPCRLPPELVARFLAAVPTVQNGDVGDLLFTGQGVTFGLNGRSLGHTDDADFARVILSTFLGPYPTSPELKPGLLGHGR